MWFKNITDGLFFSVPSDIKTEFELEICSINIKRGKITCLGFFFMEFFTILVSIINYKVDMLRYPNSAYLIMYIIMLCITPVYYMIFTVYDKDIMKYRNKINRTGLIFTLSILLWCAAISILDQLSSGQVIIYTIAVICIAVCPYLQAVALLGVYLPVQLIFVSLLPYFQTSGTLLFDNYINTTTIIIIAYLISRMMYKSKYDDFINKITVQEKNRELEEVNQKLTELNRKLAELSVTDSLTGLYNRRKFDEYLTVHWHKCKNLLKPVSLIMIDIDHFKHYNDFYGHQYGDECITKISDTFIKLLQDTKGMVARYGGEEFILALPDMDRETAVTFAENIRNSIEELQIRHENSETSDYVTISLGVSTVIPDDTYSIRELESTADKALYLAKRNRNTVEFLELTPPYPGNFV